MNDMKRPKQRVVLDDDGHHRLAKTEGHNEHDAHVDTEKEVCL